MDSVEEVEIPDESGLVFVDIVRRGLRREVNSDD